MVTYHSPALDFSTFPVSDGAPMAETNIHQQEMVDLQFAAHHLLESQGITDYAVGGNQFLYYNRHNGWEHCAPDVYIALGVPPGGRRKWETWIEGKCPDIVMEITSPSTTREDQDKIALYERLGAAEYYIHDPEGETTPVFAAYQRQGGRLFPMPLLPSGGIMSPLLAAELRPVGGFLRIIDPASGEPLLAPDEVWLAWQEAQGRLDQMEQAWQSAEARARDEEQARLTAEARAREEERARLAAEARVARLEVALRTRANGSSAAGQES